ncbi:MAG: TIGR02302 family protein [Hyphomicrobiaceae bacterium]
MPTERNEQVAGANPVFERKVRWSRAALFLERLWPRLWSLLALAALFLAVTFAGVWTSLPEYGHWAGMGAFGLAALAALIWIFRTPLASRDQAIRRIEARSGVPHRPASSYEDSFSSQSGDADASTLWAAHRQRLAAQISRLKIARPAARTDRLVPFALRGLIIAVAGLALWMAGDSAADRLRSAFRIGPPELASTARLDAWVTPPSYTGKAPIILADGARPQADQLAGTGHDNAPIEVPEGSRLVVRASGTGVKGFTLEVRENGGEPRTFDIKPEDNAKKASEGGALDPNVAPALTGSAVETTRKLMTSSEIKVVGSSLPAWHFKVIPDKAPVIHLTKEPQRLPRGSLKLTYKIEDDYGIASAEAIIRRAKPQPGDPATEWARRKPYTGPRPPLEPPPRLPLRLPLANSKDGVAFSYHELTDHPWAGSRVKMVLVAKDYAGKIGKSPEYELILPQRRFTNPIAKAVVEQRRYLVEDPRSRQDVRRALEAISIEPEGFIKDRRAYLGLRSAYWRLQHELTRAGLKTTVDQLWHVALRLEDGDLSETERRLRELQEQLSKALRDGASDQEIKRLMDELRQALNDFMQQLQQQAQNQPMQFPRNLSPENMLRQQDLDRLMRDIENMARQGSRDTAQQMLSQLRDMLEQLQTGRMAQGQSQQNQQMMQMMNEFGNIIGQQQELLDDTFGAQRGDKPGDRPGEQQGQQQGQQGQNGQQPGQQQGQNGQNQGPGQRPGQGNGRGQDQAQGRGQGSLSGRQGQLRGRLGQLQNQMRQFGMKVPGQLDGAQRSMEEAERRLSQGDLEGGSRAEQQALEQLRQGVQQMARQMMQQMRRFSMRPGTDAPLDPLGRPQRTEGPDLGTSVKIPDEIDTQRAREILEELRRRLGEPTRPQPELDYLERLLRRF